MDTIAYIKEDFARIGYAIDIPDLLDVIVEMQLIQTELQYFEEPQAITDMEYNRGILKRIHAHPEESGKDYANMNNLMSQIQSCFSTKPFSHVTSIITKFTDNIVSPFKCSSKEPSSFSSINPTTFTSSHSSSSSQDSSISVNQKPTALLSSLSYRHQRDISTSRDRKNNYNRHRNYDHNRDYRSRSREREYRNQKHFQEKRHDRSRSRDRHDSRDRYNHSQSMDRTPPRTGRTTSYQDNQQQREATRDKRTSTPIRPPRE
jgi:hypothetical protein